MRPIFVGGCPRSGTTLLGAMLGAHSHCVCVPEMPFKFQMLLRLDGERTGNISLQKVSELLEGRFKFEVWDVPLRTLRDSLQANSESIGRSDAVPPRWIAYRQVVETLVEQYAEAVDRPQANVWVDHTPFNIRHVHKLTNYFPDAFFVHLIRDGRGVASSLLRVDFGPDSVLDVAHQWAEWLGFGLAAEQWSPQKVVRVKFEELLRRPEYVMSYLCDRFDLPRESQMGTATDFRVPSHTHEHHALIGRPPDVSRAKAWKEGLKPRQIELFESVADDLLQSLGYEPQFGQRARRASAIEKMQIRLKRTSGSFRNSVKRSLRRARS